MLPSVKRIVLNSGITPDRLPGLAAWYDASDSATVLTQVGGATAFASASSQYLACPHHADLSATSNMTFCGWVKAASSARQNLFIKTVAASNEYLVYIDPVGHAAMRSLSGGASATASLTFAIGTWYFVCGRISLTDNKLYCSVNGGAEASATLTSAITTNTTELRIGRDDASAVYTNGSLDELCIWRRALTSDERTWLYNSGAGRTYSEADASMKTNLVSWWSMNAPASGNWSDQHGTNHLTPSASRPTATDGVTFRQAADTETVRRWLDKSGNGRHMNQTTLANQPTFVGGRLSFSALARQFLENLSGGPWTFTGAGAILCVVKPTLSDASSYRAVIAQFTAGGTSLCLLVADYPNAGLRYTLDAFGNRSSSKESGTLSVETAESFSWDNWQTGAGVTGATGNTTNTITSTGSGSPSSLPAGAFYIGRTDTGSPASYVGTIAEIVCLTSAVAPNILAKYFFKKWGTTL